MTTAKLGLYLRPKGEVINITVTNPPGTLIALLKKKDI